MYPLGGEYIKHFSDHVSCRGAADQKVISHHLPISPLLFYMISTGFKITDVHFWCTLSQVGQFIFSFFIIFQHNYFIFFQDSKIECRPGEKTKKGKSPDRLGNACHDDECFLKVKDSKACHYCGKADDIAYFFKMCPKVNEFWSYWINWW